MWKTELPAEKLLGRERSDAEKVCLYITQPLVELYGVCMMVLKVS